MRAKNRLTAKGAASLGPGKHPDGAGLQLVKREDGGAQWVLRITVFGRRREMGLGAYPEVSLAEARTRAEAARTEVRAGRDPIRERARKKREAERNLHLLADVANDAFEARKPQLKGDGEAGRWMSALNTHVLPKLGKTPIAEIDQVIIRDCLKPIWHTKPETARKAITRLAIVMRHGAALGLDVDIQAVDKARALLGEQVHKETHIPSMHWRDVPAFYASLTDFGTVTLALKLLILTGLRSGPVRLARLDQIEGDVLVIPGEGMKGRRGKTDDFHVPLSDEALRVIEQAKGNMRDGLLFPSPRKGPISDMSMSKLMERRGLDARPHGFRSSLRTWIAETTDTPHDVAEMMIAHSVGSKTTRAYFRTDHIEQRRILSQRWADYVTGGMGKVIKLAASG